MFKSFSNLVNSFAQDAHNLVGGRYEIISQIGKGAMGQVFKAKDTFCGDFIVAIKFLSEAIVSERMCNIFEKEAKVSTLLGEQSNHIVKVRDYGFDQQKTPYYVMEYLDGNDLSQMMKKRALSLGKFLSLTRQICLGLECAHNGILVNGELVPIIHRDIKPSNIFLVKDDKIGHFVKLLDFGVAQISSPDQGETQRKFMGTPEYCSPEQMAEEKLDPTSDIYSLGVLMYKMLSQKSPITVPHHNFQAWYKAHHESMPPKLPRYLNLPSELEEIIMKCLAKSPQQRPQSVSEILRVVAPLEREYNQNKPQSNSSSSNISDNFQDQSNPSTKLTLKETYLRSNWPDNKPQKKIVFPNVTQSQEGDFASLWTMLEAEEIKHFKPSNVFDFHHFLLVSEPYPMILWINLLYNRQYKPKWLPCYLDLKTELGYQVVTNLIRAKTYHILIFAVSHPDQYQELLTIKINQEKIDKLQNFLVKANSWQGKKQPEASRVILKKQFESVKDTIIQAIDRRHS